MFFPMIFTVFHHLKNIYFFKRFHRFQPFPTVCFFYCFFFNISPTFFTVFHKLFLTVFSMFSNFFQSFSNNFTAFHSWYPFSPLQPFFTVFQSFSQFLAVFHRFHSFHSFVLFSPFNFNFIVFWSYFVMVILSAQVERFSVSCNCCMRDVVCGMFYAGFFLTLLQGYESLYCLLKFMAFHQNIFHCSPLFLTLQSS